MISFTPSTQVFHLQGETYSYFMQVRNGILTHLYWGDKLPDADISLLIPETKAYASFDSDYNRLPYEVPTQEKGYFSQRALNILNAQGDDVLSLRYQGHRILPGKKALPALPAAYAENDAETLEIDLRDDLTHVLVTLSYTVYQGFDVLCRSLQIKNEGTAPLRIANVQEACVFLPKGEYDMLHLKGSHCRERHVLRSALPRGSFSLDSRRGASGHENNPFLAVMERNADEHKGQVYAMTHVYSGSFRLSVDTSIDDRPIMMLGMNPDVFSWHLEAGESFQSPEALLVYSAQGLNGMSQRFHKFIRKRICRGTWRDAPRPILVNNWEATYFGFNEEKLLEIARRGAEIGCELFVMDDGWFGKRDTDNCSLGDWVVDQKKLPNGLKPLGEKLNALGLQFGIWFEPEMVSPDSELYRAHPDWCLHVDGRDRTQARQQLILDMGRREVQDYIIQAVCSVLESANITYVKWDMNRNMTEAFSCVLPAHRKLESQHRYMLGLYRVLEEITSRFPHVLFESCSGGGGRFDCGMLYYMPQTWTSDDTDAYERIGIQYGTSMVYPCSAMGAHVSVVPNHQTNRITPFETRCNVALGGNFGFELDLSKLSDEDTQKAKAAVQLVKELRTVLQQGTFSRLIDPSRHDNLASWQFVSEDEDQVVVCLYQRRVKPNMQPERVYLANLQPHARYRLEGTEEVYSGAALMHIGLSVPHTWRDYESWVFRFRKV